MLPDQTYENPPLIEVLSDFYFDLGEGEAWDPMRLAEMADLVKAKGFPMAEIKRGRGLSVPHGSRQPRRPSRSNYRHRHSFTAADGSKAVQVEENVLVVNQTPPYYGWSKFRKEAVDLLSIYLNIWPSARIAYCGLHYVDVVDIPDESFYIDEYLRFYPVIPEELSTRNVNNLVMAFEVEGCKAGDVCTIQYQQRPSSTAGKNSFRFRWDYVSLEGFDSNLETAEKWLDQAHDYLHTAFRSAYTQKCAELFGPMEKKQ